MRKGPYRTVQHSPEMHAAYGVRQLVGNAVAAQRTGVDISQLRRCARDDPAKMPPDCAARAVHFVGDGSAVSPAPPAGTCGEPLWHPYHLYRMENDVFCCVAWEPCGCPGRPGWRPVIIKLGSKKVHQQGGGKKQKQKTKTTSNSSSSSDDGDGADEEKEEQHAQVPVVVVAVRAI
jgi:hypothetical protein